MLMISCNSTSSPDEKMKEAASIYEEALRIETKVSPLMEELIQRRNGLSVQGRALSQEEQGFIDRVYALEERFSEWKESRIVMPESPSVSEGTTSKRSPSEWLRIQKEYRDVILAIQNEVAQLTTDN